MVAVNMSFEDAAPLVLCARNKYELVLNFEMFAGLLEIRTPAELKAFGRACGIPLQCVEVPPEAFEDPTHPLHFLTKAPEDDDALNPEQNPGI